MPELPEVETIRRDLHRAITGQHIATVEVTGLRSIRQHSGPEEFVRRLSGQTVAGVGRRGKYVVVALSGADVLVIHLGMSGQLLLAGHPAQPRAKHTHVVLGFSDAGELRFVDPRTFGHLCVMPATVTSSGASGAYGFPAGVVAAGSPGLAGLGWDPLDVSLTPAVLGRAMRGRRVMLKTLLMDQHFLAGIGNIYSDEILFGARLGYDRRSDGLGDGEVDELHQAMVGILADAIDHRGSSLADEQYRDVFGHIGGFQSRHQVYGREGLPCFRCGDPIERLKMGGRSHFRCPTCQH